MAAGARSGRAGTRSVPHRAATALAMPVVLVVLVVLVAVGCGDDGGPRRDDQGVVTGAGTAAAVDLRAGDCVDLGDTADEAGDGGDGVGEAGGVEPSPAVARVRVVPCDEPHGHEVLAVVELDAGRYPGTDALDALAEERCVGRFPDYVGVPFVDSDLFVTFLLPSPEGWAAGDRAVTCFVTAAELPLTAPLAGSGR